MILNSLCNTLQQHCNNTATKLQHTGFLAEPLKRDNDIELTLSDEALEFVVAEAYDAGLCCSAVAVLLQCCCSAVAVLLQRVVLRCIAWHCAADEAFELVVAGV